MNISLIVGHLKSLFLNIINTTCNKPFGYHSAREKSASLRVNFKETASKFALPFL